MNTLADIKKVQAELTAKIQKDGRKLLMAEFKKFFEENPDIEAIRWTQGTPSFNDGEPCTFSVHDFTAKVNGEFYEQYDDELKPYEARIVALEESVRDEEVMEGVFGNDQEITATRKGFSLEDYYCE
jgi:hypothetical protein